MSSSVLSPWIACSPRYILFHSILSHISRFFLAHLALQKGNTSVVLQSLCICLLLQWDSYWNFPIFCFQIRLNRCWSISWSLVPMCFWIYRIITSIQGDFPRMRVQQSSHWRDSKKIPFLLLLNFQWVHRLQVSPICGFIHCFPVFDKMVPSSVN